jgi:heme-degrading monooxygenase HmoA
MPAIPWRTRSQARPDEEYLVMASRLPLRSFRTIPRFLWLTASVARQLEHADGLVGYSLLAKPFRRTFWTLSAWQSRQALDAFVRAMPHLGVMRTLRPHMAPTRFTFWTVPGSALPISWDEAVGRLARASASGAP